MTDLAVLGVPALDETSVDMVRGRLEEALRIFLTGQRWFGSRTRPIASLTIADAGPVQPRRTAWLLIVDVAFEGGGTGRYAVPVADLGPGAARRLLAERPASALAWLDARDGRLLADAASDDSACRGLLAAIEGASTSRLAAGSILSERDAGPVLPEALDDTPVRRTGAEQSNSSMVFGAAAILKIYRRLEPGPHPELELGRFLRREGFEDVPAVLGSMEYVREGHASALAVVHALVPGATDGWEHALRHAAGYFDRVGRRPAAEAAEAMPAAGPLDLARAPLGRPRALVGEYLDAAATLGRQTAALHLTLLRGAGEALDPEPLDRGDLVRLIEGTRARAKHALALLASERRRLDPGTGAAAERLIGQQPALFDRLDALGAMPIDGLRTRVHQDYHLGQLLWTGQRYVLLDFEGEPARPLAERRAKRSPLVDVAGMLRSYSYAAWSALFRWSDRAGAEPHEHMAWATLWESAAVASFLGTYLDALRPAAFLPRDPTQLGALLDLFMLDKALYELEYELNNRPDWIAVPVEGLLRIIED